MGKSAFFFLLIICLSDLLSDFICSIEIGINNQNINPIIPPKRKKAPNCNKEKVIAVSAGT
jgi:hypothetical protein